MEKNQFDRKHRRKGGGGGILKDSGPERLAKRRETLKGVRSRAPLADEAQRENIRGVQEERQRRGFLCHNRRKGGEGWKPLMYDEGSRGGGGEILVITGTDVRNVQNSKNQRGENYRNFKCARPCKEAGRTIRIRGGGGINRETQLRGWEKRSVVPPLVTKVMPEKKKGGGGGHITLGEFGGPRFLGGFREMWERTLSRFW